MDDGLARCQKMVEQYPNQELARFSLGRALFHRRQFASARDQFTVALQRKPDWIVALLFLGKCEQALGNHADARTALERARQLVIGSGHEGPITEIEQALAELDRQWTQPGLHDEE